MNKAVAFVWGLLFLCLMGYFAFIHGALPDHLAVHFDAAGNPNGFEDKALFTHQFIAFAVGMNALFLVASYVLKAIPAAHLNIPWKAYWTSTEERSLQAFSRIRSVLGLGGCFVSVVFLVLEQIIYQANVTAPAFSVPINGATFAVLVVAVFFTAFLFLVLRPPKGE